VAIGVQAKDVNRTVHSDRWLQLNGKRSGFAQLASREDIWFEELATGVHIFDRSEVEMHPWRSKYNRVDARNRVV
jgi:hypothetical protein